MNISQLIRFARASSHVTDFNNRNKFLTDKLFQLPTPKSRAKVCAQCRMSLSPPGSLLATDRSKAVVLV